MASDLQEAAFELLPKTHIEKIEDGIVAALVAALNAKFVVRPFPDDPDAFDLANIEKAALVQYAGSLYRAPHGTNSGTQERQAEFTVHVYLRAVGTPLRATHELDQVRLALQGVRISGAELFMVQDGLVERDGPLWRYRLNVACRIPALPRPRVTPTPFTDQFAQSEGG